MFSKIFGGPKMLDSHVHIEHQPYSLELIDNMVKVAQFKGIDELNLS